MVLSAVFWPAFREEKLKVPEEVQKYVKFSLEFGIAVEVMIDFVP